MASGKMPVSVVQEMCAKFSISPPVYELKSQTGQPHDKTFEIKVTLEQLNVSATGIAKAKQDAKHEAARNLISKIVELKNLHTESPDTVVIQQCILHLQEAGYTERSGNGEELKENASAALNEWCFHRELPGPQYELLHHSGPSHGPLFVMSCTVKDLITTGEGRSKKIARKLAAEDMLQKLKSGDASLHVDTADQASV